ncbi:dicarboxylic amino acid permease [Fusarium pseudocircinatum]|uniref:Dicarboxylic amino acid permease n=1 Tax=Fusarium pseudocircinatum TaxID=56676 RepID=A0A8H5UTI9_9HYPO|nr:dicarboxylic amino acid permease [Fusarium pseudocircinatum]
MTSDEGTMTAEGGQLRREFKARHVSMIAVAGAIGTGLIIGTGTALVRGGPANLLIAYCLVGSIVFFVMTALGEMSIMFPMDKGFGGYATRFVDPALGYATAAGIIIQYWRPDLNVAIFVTVFTVVIILVNLLHVSFFGEAEFWLSCIKLLVMTTLILTCFVISVEVVGVAFGEAPNPRKTIRNAIRQTLWRIVFFYVIGAIVLGMAVPYTSAQLIGGTKQKTGAGASPFVIAVQLAGIPHFPDVINGCLLVFVLSAANSDIYIGSRVLFGLSHDHQAPAIFGKTTSNGVPLAGVVLTSLFAALAYLNAARSSSVVFGYLVSLVTVFGALNWVNILVTYIGFTRGLKTQGIDRSSMPYRGSSSPMVLTLPFH